LARKENVAGAVSSSTFAGQLDFPCSTAAAASVPARPGSFLFYFGLAFKQVFDTLY
jgi:hypothetical protein